MHLGAIFVIALLVLACLILIAVILLLLLWVIVQIQDRSVESSAQSAPALTP
jgi:hypothetical protein